MKIAKGMLFILIAAIDILFHPHLLGGESVAEITRKAERGDAEAQCALAQELEKATGQALVY